MLAFNVPVQCMLSTLDCDITSIGKVVVSAARHRRCACCTLQLVLSCIVLGDDTVSDGAVESASQSAELRAVLWADR